MESIPSPKQSSPLNGISDCWRHNTETNFGEAQYIKLYIYLPISLSRINPGKNSTFLETGTSQCHYRCTIPHSTSHKKRCACHIIIIYVLVYVIFLVAIFRGRLIKF